MPEPRIREASRDDAARLAAVYRNAYRENRELGFPASAESATEPAVADWIRDHHVFVAELDDTVVGGVRLTPAGDDRVKLSRLGVHSDWKDNGVGSSLLDHAEQTVRDWGCGVVWLTTPPDHPYLPGFYRRRGYEEAEPYPLENRDYDEVVMEKRLD